MRIARPRLLIASLVIAVAVSVVGAMIWAERTGSDDGPVDASLDAPGDREAPPVDVDPDCGLANCPNVGDPLPSVALGDREGNEILTADFVGDPLVINFWFSTCPPCAKELPDFAEVHAERGDEVRFIGVNPQDSIEVMERFASERGVEYELYRDDFGQFTNAIGALNFPITLFVTADGGIVEQTGPIDADELRAEIDELLEVST